MKSLYLLVIVVIALFGTEPIKPFVNSLGHGDERVLTHDGNTLIMLNRESASSERQVIDLKSMSYSSRKSYLSPFARIKSNSKFYIMTDKEYIKLYDSKSPTQQIKVLENKYEHIYLSESYLFGLEKNSTVIHIHTLPDLKEIENITIPIETKIPEFPKVIANDKNIYIQLHDKRYIIDVDHKSMMDVSSNFIDMHRIFSMKWILEDGSYIIGSIGDKYAWGVFDTVTLERNRNLEKYLNEHQYIKHISKYNDDQIMIVHNAGIDFWDIKKHSVIRTIPLNIKDHFNVLRQNNFMIVSKVFSPIQLIDLTRGLVTEQPYARHKPYGVFIEKNIPKAILRYSNTQAGIWNIIEHKWEYLFPELIDPQKISNVIRDDDNLFFIVSPGIEMNNFSILQWSLSEKKEKNQYCTDKYNNIPNLINIDKKHSKLLIHYDDKFYIYDMKNGEKLHELKSPDRNPSVYDMEITDDGTKFNIYTNDTKGFVKVEMGTSYKYDHKASIYSWSLADEKIGVMNNEKVSKATNGKVLYKSDNRYDLSVKDDKIEIVWDESIDAMVLRKLTNPYRFMYLYTPKNASSWIDIDNQGYFDSSRDGENYLYQCEKQLCHKVDNETIKYYKRKNMLKIFLKE